MVKSQFIKFLRPVTLCFDKLDVLALFVTIVLCFEENDPNINVKITATVN